MGAKLHFQQDAVPPCTLVQGQAIPVQLCHEEVQISTRLQHSSGRLTLS